MTALAPERAAAAPRGRAPAAVLFVHEGEDWIRGSEQCLLDLVARIDRRRFRPVVWCNSPVLADAVRALDAPVLVGRGWEGARARRWPSRALVGEARRIIGAHDARLVHANDVGPVKWLIPAARAARVPLLAHIHHPTTEMERCLSGLHQASRTVAVSHHALQGFLDDGLSPPRARVVYNGVDAARLNAGSARGLRAALGVPADAVVTAFVGSLIPRKAPDVLLRAFAATPGHLVVVGDGPERPALAALAQALGVAGRVHFLGERGDVGAILRDASDIFASPSRSEAFPLTPLEAAAAGLPVVVSDIAPHREAVVVGETGLLFPVDDVGALAAALGRLAADPALRGALGAAGRRRVEREFDIGRYVARFEGLYDELLTRPRWRSGWLGDWTWPRVYWRWVARAAARRVRRRPAGGAAGAAAP
ncbi:MAG TPA: glycosyltransferase family 4 protein [Gemmatimonadaceae bacterium]|nr:glycosyltransferase family 4 protein [Gemmatimonadaceae bacterium]